MSMGSWMRHISDQLTSIITEDTIKTTNARAEIVFHDASSAAGDGEAQSVGAYTNLKVEIYSGGGNSARTINFWEKMTNGTRVKLTGVKRYGFTVAESTSGVNEVWEFSVTGAHEIVMELASITSGTVTIKGTLVA